MSGSDHPSPPDFARNALAEPWNLLTVSGLAASAAAANPERLFLRDCASREDWDGNLPRQLSFADFHREAEFFAGQLETLGIVAGDRALILMPNVAEAAITIVGCLMAGITPALAPLEENIDTLRAACERISAAAIITTGRLEELRPAEIARQIAARAISVRVVAAFGHKLPDGVISLDGWSEQDVDANPNRPLRRQEAEGLITFSVHAKAVLAHIRTEAQVFADALAVATRHKLGREQNLVSTMHATGSAAFAAGLLMPLFQGTTIELVGPFTAARLRNALRRAGEKPALLAPASLLPLLRESLRREKGLAGLGSLVAVMRPGMELVEAASEFPFPVVPVFDLNERALVAPEAMPMGLADLMGSHQHPMEAVLTEDQPYLMISEGDDGVARAFGFAASDVVARAGAVSEAA
ncbi:MAG: acyl--CoA ligase [Methylobacterium sp.]|nr:acyl--CoA ligase [Methylobacterium sp.]MCA3658460.1 acyl--CoA ligase [Methylobacterium sp.]MCA3660758.1 acyl--CoA ligase [Methylobacterium sp.]MCA3664091.1 acyl--CoA ligase [Methylobacterium sp.]MCA3669010.1 acyl--CoA ligase [Methylobacterium sp.]